MSIVHAHFLTQSYPLVYQDILLTFYYGSIALGATGYYSAAVDQAKQVGQLIIDAPKTHAAGQCLSVPTQNLSAIQVEAFRKAVLFQLLDDGSVSVLSRPDRMCSNSTYLRERSCSPCPSMQVLLYTAAEVCASRTLNSPRPLPLAILRGWKS